MMISRTTLTKTSHVPSTIYVKSVGQKKIALIIVSFLLELKLFQIAIIISRYLFVSMYNT